MASVSVLVSAAHVSVSVLVSEVPALSTGSREPASASRPNLDGLGLGLGLGGPGLDYNPDRHNFIPISLAVTYLPLVDTWFYAPEF